MTKLKTWVAAARLRTLPLSIAGILTGTAIAVGEGVFEGSIFVLALCTTLGLQILSNFANDYGDGVKGTDNEDRIGPIRALQSGIISDKEMKNAMILTSCITLVFAVLLIYEAFGKHNFGYSLLFFLLGILSIAAAIKYTVGNTAYGYRGLGDLFVFLFFGLLSVAGMYFLYTKHLSLVIFLPAITIGLLSTAVLNLNNMRDIESDKKAKKNTLAVKLGIRNAKKYHSFLIIGGFVSVLVYLLSTHATYGYAAMIAFIPLFVHLRKVLNNTSSLLLDPELKKVALSTFLFSLLYFITAFM